MRTSKVLRKIRSGEVVKVATISRFPEGWLAELTGRLGYDAVWLDLEHRPFGYDAIEDVSLGCRATDQDLMVRILKTGYHSPMRALEMGANGIMVPHCMSAAEARQWAEWVRFPPLGKRGFDGAGADTDYLLADTFEYIKHANAETFLALQIEDREAVECVEEIAEVEGVDLLFVGPGDLSLSYGIPFQSGHATMKAAIARIANAAAKHGKAWGIATGDVANAQQYVNQGAQMVTSGNDLVAVVEGFQRAWEEYRALEPRK